MPKIVMMRLTVPNGLNIMKSPAAAMRIGTTYIIAGMGMRLLERISATISEMLAKSNMLSLVDSLVAPLSLVNALIVALATAREEALANTLDMLEKIWQENNIYERRADQI